MQILQLVGQKLLGLVDPEYLIGDCVPFVPEFSLPLRCLFGPLSFAFLHFRPHALPVELFLLDVVLVMHVIVLDCEVGIVSDVSGVEEVAAEKGRVDVVLVGPAVLVGTVEGGVLFPLAELFVDVDASAGGRARLLAVVGRVAHLNNNNYWQQSMPK